MKGTIVFEKFDDIEWGSFDSFWEKARDYKEKSGIYVFWNKTKNKYYVGQSVNIFGRVCYSHFCDEMKKCNNKRLKIDFEKGDEFFIKVLEIPKQELDYFEEYFIKKFDSYCNGYNKIVVGKPTKVSMKKWIKDYNALWESIPKINKEENHQKVPLKFRPEKYVYIALKMFLEKNKFEISEGLNYILNDYFKIDNQKDILKIGD